MQTGAKVRRRSTGEVGFVLFDHDELVEIAIGNARQSVHRDDLELLIEGAADPLTDPDVELHRSVPYELRLRALYLQHAYRFDPLTGLSNARIEPALHQVYVTHRVTQKIAPRMVLADEVGLGKTIEAGLILKELRARGLVERALVVVPANLQQQWMQELSSKFNERFQIVDGAYAAHHERLGTNPWTSADNVICSLSFARRDERREQIIEAPWDLVVFDEAHRVRSGPSNVTKAYRLADELKDRVTGLLLLTATPMQISTEELYNTIELVEPGLFTNFHAFQRDVRRLPRLISLMHDLQRWATTTERDRERILDHHAQLLQELDLGIPVGELSEALDVRESREGVMDAVVTRHPLSQVMVRNRKVQVGGFMPRTAKVHLVPPTPAELEIYEAVSEYLREGYARADQAKNMAIGFLMVTYHKMLASSAYAIARSLERRIEKLTEQRKRLEQLQRFEESGHDSLSEDELDELSEVVEELAGLVVPTKDLDQEIEELKGLVAQLNRLEESKPERLLDLIDQVEAEEPDAKVLVFTQFVETQRYLERLLQANGYSVTVFNGRLSLDEKEAAVRRFRENTQVMISTEAGGEGRNFQFCHHLVNYDLPWNPMRVEQRIGRIDRIGQKHPVMVHNLALADTIEQRVLTVLKDRIHLFEQSIGALDPILGDVEEDIARIVMSPRQGDAEAAFSRLEKDLEQRVREAREKEEQLADLVLDRASLRRDVANELLERSTLADWKDLRSTIEQILEYHGGVVTEGERGEAIISLSPDLASQLPVRGQVHVGVFDPRLALRLEDLQFFAIGNDLIDGILALATDVDPVQVAARRVGAGDQVHLEVFYELRSEGTMHPTGELRRHIVGVNLEPTSELITDLPATARRERGMTAPAWIADALQTSQELAKSEALSFRMKVVDQHRDEQKEQRERLEQLAEYRDTRFTARIAELQDQIARLEHGSEQQRRIIPALQGQIDRQQERSKQLHAQLGEDVQKLDRQHADVDLRHLASGLLIGELR